MVRCFILNNNNMSEYPDPDEEFELLYGDELELLRDQDDFEEPFRPPPQKSRRILDFNAASSFNNGSQDLFSQSQNSVANNVNNGLPLEESVDGLETQTNRDVVLRQSEMSLSSNKKRTVEDLFGDIDDLDNFFYEGTQPSSKKQKTNEFEENLALIERIVQLRKFAKEKHNITNLKVTNRTKLNYDRDKKNLSFRVPKYPFIGVTRFDKEKVYVRFHSEDYEKDETMRIVKESSFQGVMGDSFKEIWKEAERLINVQINMEEEQSNAEVTEQTDNKNEQLWVDLYKPRKYLELLSDESTNRIMLRWIKLWDKCVFNRKPKIKPIKTEENPKNKFHKFFKMQELDTTLDEQGRPKYKVALLCGPPGLGKTTLAHMVAKHAGYNVVEINASDDRSTDAFKTALENATQMRSVVDREGRPNCLVFDEIDGAPTSSIDFLIKFVNGNVSNKPKKGKTQKQSILKRPIICICNDVYVPSLRALRHIAFVINFPPTSSARLAERLMDIARRQQIKTDLGAMIALAEKSNKDIRSCLSVLHFYKAQGKAVTLSEVYKTNIGQKDMQRGLFAVWQDIFFLERPKNHDKCEKPETNTKTRMSKILQIVSSFGDYGRLAQGVFENFPYLKLKDSTLESLCRCMNWFIFSDLINKQIYTLQNYELMNYLQYAFVVWHFVFATSMKQKLNYPSAGNEARQKENQHKALVSEVLRGLQPRVRPYCQRMSLILDIIPLLTIIIVPNFRPVSLHLYTKEEKENMLTVVNIMIDYNLNYVQERLPDGTFSFNLEPNIENIVAFDKENSIKRKALSYSNKQLIAREIELEKLRRFENSKNFEEEKVSTAADTSGNDATNKSPTNQELTSKCPGNKSKFTRDFGTPIGTVDNSHLPNHLQMLQVKSVKVQNSAPRKDFFGRVIKNTSPKGKVGPEINNDIWYQYKEGYSNAVRKTITVSYLK